MKIDKQVAFLKFMRGLNKKELQEVAIAAVERLIEIDEVRYYPPDEYHDKDRLSWESCGDDLRGEDY